MTIEFTAEQQAEVDRIVGKTRQEARDRVKNEFEAEMTKRQEDAERVKLAENNEYKELAEKLGVQVSELESYKEQVGKYQEIMQGVLDYELKDMSDEAKKAVESLPGDVTVKLKWLNDNKTLFENQTGDGVGTPALGRPSGGKNKSRFMPTGL